MSGLPTGIDIRFDDARGLLLCRVIAPLSCKETAEISRALIAAAAQARQSGALRVLWDNRVGIPLPPELTDMFRTLLVEQGRPDDRVAIIVGNSLAKAQSRLQMANGHEVFASENAALTWLSVGSSSSAAA